jgi:hypothetical protein
LVAQAEKSSFMGGNQKRVPVVFGKPFGQNDAEAKQQDPTLALGF